MTADRLNRLTEYWRANGASSAGGASEPEVHLFEVKHNVVLPSDMREYFLSLNGMDTYKFCDYDLYSFWQLQNVITIAESVPDRAHLFSESDRYFYFADHFISLPGYAIRLSCDLREGNRIAQVFSDFPKLEVEDFTDSFTDFVDQYLENTLDKEPSMPAARN